MQYLNNLATTCDSFIFGAKKSYHSYLILTECPRALHPHELYSELESEAPDILHYATTLFFFVDGIRPEAPHALLHHRPHAVLLQQGQELLGIHFAQQQLRGQAACGPEATAVQGAGHVVVWPQLQAAERRLCLEEPWRPPRHVPKLLAREPRDIRQGGPKPLEASQNDAQVPSELGGIAEVRLEQLQVPSHRLHDTHALHLNSLKWS